LNPAGAGGGIPADDTGESQWKHIALQRAMRGETPIRIFDKK
jgi:hypothetical protein